MILIGVSGFRILCVGAIVTDGRGRLLLIQRGHEPGAGLWSLPGGRVEPGETDAEALVREMEEETGLTVEPGRLIGQVDRPGRAGDVLDIRDYAATVTGGTLRPGDDAADARWVAPEDLAVLPVTEGLVEALTEWVVLGQQRSLLSRFPFFASGCYFAAVEYAVHFAHTCLERARVECMVVTTCTLLCSGCHNHTQTRRPFAGPRPAEPALAGPRTRGTGRGHVAHGSWP